MNINEPAYPPYHDPEKHVSGLTKLELAALMMAQGMLCNSRGTYPTADLITDSVRIAKGVLEECAK